MRKSEKSEKKVTTKSSSQEKSEKKVTSKSSSQSKKTDSKKSKDFDRKSGEVLGLKLINPDKACDGQNEKHSVAVPIKIPFANETRFSNGQAAYFYDILSPLFEKHFGKEAADDFKAFSEAPVKPVPEGESPEEQIKTAGKISETDLENGFHAYNWRPKDLEPEDYIF